MADLPNINTEAVLADIKSLSADAMEGRAPGTPGEALAVNYITGQFRAAGLEPGNPDGTWIQKVPLAGITPSGFSPLVVKKGGHTLALKHDADVVAFSPRVTDAISLNELRAGLRGLRRAGARVSVGRLQGHGRQGQDDRRARQRPAGRRRGRRDEARREDLRRQGDDVLRPLDLQVREGRRARRRGVFIVHETGPAGLRSAWCRETAANGSI